MDIKNPRRALAISLQADEEHLSRIIHGIAPSPTSLWRNALIPYTRVHPERAISPECRSTHYITGSKPIPTEGSLAGITHDLALKNKYYTTTVPIWLDLLASPSEWASSFLSAEAAEVLGVLGGLLLVFAIPEPTASTAAPTRQLIQQVGTVVCDGLGGWEWDGVKLAIGVGSALDVDEWDELCAEAGLEFVQVGGGENKLQQFGEKSGISRVKEALEANDWDLGSADELPSDVEKRMQTSEKALDPEDMEFGLGEVDLEILKATLFSKKGLEDEAEVQEAEEKEQGEKQGKAKEEGTIDDEEVAKVEAMMRKLQAAREAGETMSETQRRKLAAKAVEEVMREL
ncbi:alpha-/gamma-adaptin-binding protein p34 [Cordyceps militaris CM01]|uniref:Alpha-/gamma-adaptin-binding protein p34 n=1 Tax=Cordyceps militaris (strain CM01) TaxID=983644 RepID=G3J2X7_CORMM|nr:alpha-/gamma-adaptin-binding protein p34 [Cordyceps militaris CM01]EGX97256.1 alpha-/gamma-adaptin-binding protein p34 [Cordyceps militaris CM01]